MTIAVLQLEKSGLNNLKRNNDKSLFYKHNNRGIKTHMYIPQLEEFDKYLNFFKIEAGKNGCVAILGCEPGNIPSPPPPPSNRKMYCR